MSILLSYLQTVAYTSNKPVSTVSVIVAFNLITPLGALALANGSTTAGCTVCRYIRDVHCVRSDPGTAPVVAIANLPWAISSSSFNLVCKFKLLTTNVCVYDSYVSLARPCELELCKCDATSRGVLASESFCRVHGVFTECMRPA